jgi:hypothetical protein
VTGVCRAGEIIDVACGCPHGLWFGPANAFPRLNEYCRDAAGRTVVFNKRKKIKKENIGIYHYDKEGNGYKPQDKTLLGYLAALIMGGDVTKPSLFRRINFAWNQVIHIYPNAGATLNCTTAFPLW